MRRLLLIFSLLVLPLSAPGAEVMVIPLDGVVNPVAAEFLTKSLQKAQEQAVEALIVELDTPGGLDASMRSVVKAINASSVPVVVYVSPPGARAASAGTFITLAAHVAAMAPQTNLGAATPVGVGQKLQEAVAKKALEDAAAYIRAIAHSRGRNARWAEQAVREGASASAEEALRLGVIDLMAQDLRELLQRLHGRKVVVLGKERTLRTAQAMVLREEMGLRLRILDLISNPNVAYILMLLGFYGLFFELTNPGAIFPGVIGGICLILAFYAFQTLPVNYAGFLLILLAIIMFILEVKVVSHGALTLGGIVAMVIGSLMLFEKGGPFLKLSLSLVLPAVLITALFFVLTLWLALRAYRRRPATGAEGLVGQTATASTDVGPQGGQVLLHGEIWSAYSDSPVPKGSRVKVQAVEGLKLKVRPEKD